MTPAETAEFDRLAKAAQDLAEQVVTWVAGVWALTRAGRADEAAMVSNAMAAALRDQPEEFIVNALVAAATHVVRAEIALAPGVTIEAKRDKVAADVIAAYEASLNGGDSP